ncbi:MAG TPA: guanylate kinase, partial [Gammaproteobacteria bacterium]|nr:guanylate kinase [Gammaproteobacteria bacterium]
MTTADLFIVSAPSGAGKTSLVNALVASFDRVVPSVSYTTRPPRPTERNGVDYHFVSPAEFDRMITAGAFLEHAEVFGNRYGTARAAIETELGKGRDVVLEIDWQGARQIRVRMPESVSIFILPPSLPELERRLRNRESDDAETIRRRLEEAAAEMSHYPEYDYVIVNGIFEQALL